MILLSQTTMQSSGMSAWSSSDWQAFFLSAGGFVTLAITPLVIALWNGKNNSDRIKQLENEKAKNNDRMQTLEAENVLLRAHTKTLAQASPLSTAEATPEIKTSVNEIANAPIKPQ